MKQRIVVIGGLAAGPSAASKAKRINPNADVILFEKSEHISYGVCEIPYYVGKTFDDPDDLIAYTPQRLEKEKGVTVRVFHSAEEINVSQKKVVVRDLVRDKVSEHPFDKLIVATGSTPRNLGLTGEDGRNVFAVKTLDQGLALRRFIDQEQPTRAVIIGGGYIGMEIAEALRNRQIDTTLLHRGDLPLSGLEHETRVAIRQELEGHGVMFVPRAEIKELVSDGTGRVHEVRTKTGSYPADLVILSLGVEPRVGLATKAGIRVGRFGGIQTDQRQATSIDSVYAAGDCCEVKNVVNNQPMYIPLATTASRQGWVAGENAAGGHATFKGVIRAIAVKVFRQEVAQVGISSGEAADSGFDVVTESISANSRISFMPGNGKLRLTLIADKRSQRLLGANIYGTDGAVLRANTLGVAIQNHLTIDQLSRLDLIYTPPYSPLWDPILIAANQLAKRL